MKEDLISVATENIINCFDINGKRYCAFRNPDDANDDSVYFALVSKVSGEEHVSVLTSVPEDELDAVVSEYDKYIDFFMQEDELSDIELEGDL